MAREKKVKIIRDQLKDQIIRDIQILFETEGEKEEENRRFTKK